MSAYRPMALDSPTAIAIRPSRRALLAGAAGTAAAAVVAMTRPARMRAAPGDPLLAGSTVGAGMTTSGVTSNSDTSATWLVTQNGKGTAIRAITPKGTAGRFATDAANKPALVATNASPNVGLGSGAAIEANGGWQTAMRASTLGSYTLDAGNVGGVAVYAHAVGGSGVYGLSDSGTGVTAQANTGWALHAYAGTFQAAWIEGKIRLDGYLEMPEVSTPSGTAGLARLLTRDNGSGKTQLVVVFGTGEQVLATEA